MEVIKMMNKSVKHVVEIAAGLVVGSLAAEGVNGVVKFVKKQVKKVNNLKKKPEAQ